MFDPLNRTIMLNYKLPLLLFLINYSFWTSNKFMILFKLIRLKFNKSQNSLWFAISKLILIINIINLVPSIFSNTHNIIFVLNLVLILWFVSVIAGINNNFNVMFMNFTPKGTRFFMIFMINTIELNRLLFMILSLSIRLMINMIIGHLIVSIINNTLMILLYIIVEFIVIIIQTYIFITLNIININNYF